MFFVKEESPNVDTGTAPLRWRRSPCQRSVAAVLSAQRTVGTTRVDEITIAGIHGAMKGGRLTCRGLVDAYLRRIDTYDKQGPALNAIVVVNPAAREEAAALDRRFSTSGFAGPLHCVPAIVKDNFETIALQSAAGSLALKGFVSTRDAFQVKKLKDAGAIVLAKSNMAEWAFTPYETVSSILPGYTKNPYALDRVTAGSSGGTAAAIAANFGAHRPGQRHRQLDPRTRFTSGAGRHPLHHGTDQPRRCGPAERAGGHCRTHDPHGRRRGGRAAGDCR